MLRNRLEMSRLAGRLLLQVAVSVTATLIGSALFAALPTLTLPGKPVAVELTSGGKYAARIPGVAPEPVETAAADPVAAAPSLAMPAADALQAIGIVDPMPASDLSWHDGSIVPAIDRPARGKPRAQRTGIVRHAAELAQASVTAHPAGLSASDAATAGAVAEDGMLGKAMSSAKSLWSLSASAGGALLSHLTP